MTTHVWNHWVGPIALVAALGAGLATAPARAATLYDAAAGSLPSAQGWAPLALGAAAAQSVGSGSYRLDTTGTGVVIWGNGLLSPVPLDTATGFDLSFSLQMVNETHTSVNRTGYSVVMVGADASKALELAFWNDHVWVYDYDPTHADRFVHGADASFDTTAAMTSYTLAVRNQQFTLTANGNSLLSGALRDYTAEGLPYTTPNFLFFGDDTSRGTSISLLGNVSVTAVPELATVALMLGGLAALAGLRQRAARR